MADARIWWLSHDKKVMYGPYSRTQISEMLERGDLLGGQEEITESTYVLWGEGTAKWWIPLQPLLGHQQGISQ